LPANPGQLPLPALTMGVSVLDFDHDGWMDLAFHPLGRPRFDVVAQPEGKRLRTRSPFPCHGWARAWGVAAFDYDNDGWVDLVAVGETSDGRGQVKLFRNLGPDGFKDVSSEVGLDKIVLKDPRAVITGDYDNDGATDLLITQNRGPAVLLRIKGAVGTTGCVSRLPASTTTRAPSEPRSRYLPPAIARSSKSLVRPVIWGKTRPS
jgi:hypothetical protein